MTEIAMEKIEAAEQSIAYNDYETVYCFDKFGEEIFKQIGTNSVEFTEEQRESLFNTILSHNHPYKAYKNVKECDTVVSYNDVSLAYKYKLLELRLVHGSKIHLFVWSDTATDDNLRHLCINIKNIVDNTKIKMDNIKTKGKEAMLRVHQDGIWNIIDFLKKNENKCNYVYIMRRRRYV